MKYKTYPEYKDSGVEWLGDVPTDYTYVRLKFLGHTYGGLSGKAGKDFNQEKHEDNKVFIPFTNIANNHYIKDNNFGTVTIASDESQNKVKKNDLFFLMSSEGYEDLGKSSLLEFNLEEGYLNSFCKGFRIENDKINPKYLNYLLSGDTYRQLLYTQGNGFTRINLRLEKLRDLPLLIAHTLQEQKTIANYLDKATAKIDTLIEKQTKLIELLKEKRQALISTAVTRGLDNQNSHWKNYRLDWISTIIRGNTGFKKDELLNNGEYVALQYGKTYKVDEVNKTFSFYVNNEFYKASQIVNYGDTILISTSETVEDLGHSCFYNRDDLGLIGGEQILLKPDTKLIHEKYLYYASKIFCNELKKYSTGLKVFRFNIDDLKNIFISIPPMAEQQCIVTHIDEKTSKIDTLISKSTKAIDLLKEKRTALISSVVTGKIDVRETA